MKSLSMWRFPGILSLLAFAVPWSSNAGQITYSTAFIPFPLEATDQSPRAAGLASAFTCAEGDSSCLYYNPAGLATVTDPQISLVHQSLLANLSRENISGGLGLGKAGGLAFGADYLGYGILQGYDVNGLSTAPYQ